MATKINPLLFMPSPRYIPQVQRHWHALPYDKYIIKNMTQLVAYDKIKEYFTKHKEYTHLVVCQDDLEVTSLTLDVLLKDIKEYDFPIITGYCPINEDESMENIYNLQLKIDTNTHPTHEVGTWIREENLKLFDNIFRVAHSGMASAVISRDLFEKIRWTGTLNSDGQLNNIKGANYDYRLSQDLYYDLDIPMLVDKRAKSKHWRNLQSIEKGLLNHSYPYEYLWRYA